MYKFLTPRHKKATIGRKSMDGGNAFGGLVSGGKYNKCVVVPPKASIVAEVLERRNQIWIVRAKVASNLIIRVGDSSFHLHKLPMVSRSGYLNRLVFQRRSDGKKDAVQKIQIDNFPGGAAVFELIVKFCYGWKVDLTAANVALVHFAAYLLEMDDDILPGNLISRTEAFLSFVLFSSWKDIFLILKSCETASLWAEELQIVKRCSEAIAWKASIDPKTFIEVDAPCLPVVANNVENSKHEVVAENWWFEDVSCLRIDHFIEVIESLKTARVKSELLGSCIAYWTRKWLSNLFFRLDNLSRHPTQNLLRVIAEGLIRVLPEEENSVPCNFLLHLLKLGIVMGTNFELLNKIECRIGMMLERCYVSELLVKNYGNNDTLYDVGVVIRVVETYVSSVLKNSAARLLVVGRLVDAYLAVVARDEKLLVEHFSAVAEALPKNARYCHDNLYRAIDMYLKAHPSITEEERTSICKAMDCRKLSQEACRHAVRNHRLPLKISTRLVLLEQVNMISSMTTSGSNYRRTRTQAIIRVSKGLEKGGLMTSQKEIIRMKKEVEKMKVQLDELQMCKIRLRRQAKRCIV